MHHLLTQDEARHHARLVDLVTATWGEDTASWERAEELPREVLQWCAEEGLLGAGLPASTGGLGWAAIEVGLMHEALGRVSASLASLVNVQGMVAQTLLRWGTERQQREVLPPLAAGSQIAAICMTEPQGGSDLSQMDTTLMERDGAFVLDGTKLWITFGAVADLFLVFARGATGPVACLLERGTPGLETHPIPDMLGLRAAGIARVEMRGCRIEPSAVVGREGFGLSVLVPHALEHGRHAVAWMAAGVMQAAVSSCAAFVRERRSFGKPLVEHGQIQSLVARMGADLEATRHLCVAASRALDADDPATTDRVLMAKYFACRAAEEQTARAVQAMGARGCAGETAAARGYRDSKILSIIEGTAQIIERMLAPRLLPSLDGGR